MNEMNREPEFRENEQNLTLGDIWGMFWNYRWWYVLSVVLCLLIAMFYLYITPDKYTRVAKVIVNEDVQTLSMSDIFSMAGGQGSSSYSSNTNNEAEAFASPDLMEQVVRRLGLETSYFEDQKVRKVEMYKTSPLELTVLDSLVSSSFSFRIVRTGDSTFVLKNFTVGPDKIKKHEVEGCLSEPVATPAGELRLDPTLNIAEWDRDIIVNWVYPMGRAKGYASNLTVAVTGKTSTVLALTLEDKFPSRAERILSTLIDVHNEAWIYDKNRSARMTTEFISDRIQVIEKELSAIETDLREYKEENNLTDIKAIGQAYLEERECVVEGFRGREPALHSGIYQGLPYGSEEREIASAFQLRTVERGSGVTDPGVQQALPGEGEAGVQQQREQPSDRGHDPVSGCHTLGHPALHRQLHGNTQA